MQTNLVRGGNGLWWRGTLAAWGVLLALPWMACGASRMVLCEEFTATS